MNNILISFARFLAKLDALDFQISEKNMFLFLAINLCIQGSTNSAGRTYTLGFGISNSVKVIYYTDYSGVSVGLTNIKTKFPK